MDTSQQPKERPILFSAPMVRAILEGRKTVTRRTVKDWQSPKEDLSEPDAELRWAALAQCHPRWGFIAHGATAQECADDLASCGVCPHGQRGDRLWVRETWYCDHDEVMRGPYLKPHDLDIGEARNDGTLVYAADGLTPYEADQPVWKPSIHMPRWACRILLEITNVRVERLQGISEDQCIAEGIEPHPSGFFGNGCTTPASAFKELWNSTGGDWDANPWVWVVEFKRVQP